MKKFLRLVLFSGVLIFPWKAQTCTTMAFTDENNDRVFAKAFDWHSAHGMVVVNKRNVRKEALLVSAGSPLIWVSKLGNVTFNQHGRDFPLGGMNEAGLVVEIMVGPTQHIPPSALYKSVNEVQWIQYVLDSFSSIGEVIHGVQNIRVAKVVQDVHYLVCDKNTECATFEYLNGKLVIHTGESLPFKAFANSTYVDSAKHALNFAGLGGQRPLPSDNSSLSRFVNAATAAMEYDSGDAVAYANKFLDKVSISGRWRIVYRGLNEVNFRADPKVSQQKKFFMDFDFSCSAPVKVFPLHQSQEGDVTDYFVDYKQQHNDWVVDTNYPLPAQLRKLMREYPQTHTLCLEGVTSLN